MTGTYDPESNTTYWGTGNGSPWFGDQRPGDNLYTSSTVAIDPDTGELKGHFQYHWNDSWDWDEMNAPMVVDYEKDGQTVKGLVKPSRNGYLYWLERAPDGQIGFVDATNYVKQDVFASIDAKTGRPTYNEDHKPGTGKYAEFCPSLWGGKDWPYEAYNPNTGMVYIPANDNHCGSLEGKVQEYVAGQWWTGVDIPDIGFTVDKNAKSYGEIQAWNVNTGERVWTQTHPVMNWGSVLTTGGGLVFKGGTNDRMFRAFDARTGEHAVAVQDQLRDHGAAVVLRGGRRAVHRRAVRLGRRSGLPAGPAQRPPGHGPRRGAAGRRDLGVRPRVSSLQRRLRAGDMPARRRCIRVSRREAADHFLEEGQRTTDCRRLSCFVQRSQLWELRR